MTNELIVKDQLPVLSSDSALSSYLDKISKLPYLTQEEEVDLANKWIKNQDINAAHLLVKSHLRLVVKVAHKFKGYGLPLLELISEGNIGLMHAVKRFDPNLGFRLSTYAMWWIKASIQEYILHSWSLVKIGTTAAQKKLFFSLRKIKKQLHKVDNSRLNNEEISEIAKRLNVNHQEVIEMDSRLSQADKSLNSYISESDEDGGEIIDIIKSNDESQESALIRKNEMNYKRKLFDLAFATLSDREKDVILKRRLNETQATLDDLSRSYNVSRERIRQIETRAMEKLQAFIANAVAKANPTTA